MRTFKIIILSIALIANGVNVTEARNNPRTGKKGPQSTTQVAAGCLPASTSTDLAYNNINLLVHTGGDMWWDLQSSPRFEVPINSGRNSLFSGALWLGGKDVSGQLKVAAQTYRSNGVDYWTGPLSTLTAEITQETCTAYDKHFVTTKDDVAQFRGWYQAGINDAANGTTTQVDNFPDYTPPAIIYDWPAHGRNYDPYNEDFYLAPFYDENGDGVYNPNDGDYPGYDLDGEVDCSDRKVNIYGDMNLWWVFNDKGNIHTESGANSIGMEIRAQAFSFATNDEVNNMTFCNYELVNRSSFTLTETYFGLFVDADLGGANDDYVGCDVSRGLGYCYNGDNDDKDDGGSPGYGENPPAIGVDFFEGPYQDEDGIDNAVGIGFNEALNGIGYGDSIPDNERYGMRRFLYFDRQGANCCRDPEAGAEYYNYLKGIWRDNSKMVYGGTGHDINSTNYADFMFPGESDPDHWGTKGVDPGYSKAGGWTESNEGNEPADRRFVQSAGPFTLTPGAINDITVGIVWARATSGGNLASVETMINADDKTQALFDNCFRVLSGPDAPELKIQEMNNKLVLYITNSEISNNKDDSYTEVDNSIIPPDSIDVDGDGSNDRLMTEEEKIDYKSYKFEGYKIYQVRDKTVDVSSLDDPDKARLIYQGDIRNGVGRIVNYEYNKELDANIPEIMVEGKDEGVKHSILVTDDQFATGNKTLVNHKTYYFIGIAYGYNNFKQFDPDLPDTQENPYISSRKAPTGAIRAVSGIPHNEGVEGNGTVINSTYAQGVSLTKVEGKGNGGTALRLTQSSIDAIMSSANYRAESLTYEEGYGPVSVQVIDPLNVVSDNFVLEFVDDATVLNDDGNRVYTWNDLSDATWRLYRENATSSSDTVSSKRTISIGYDQLILDWGISINVEQQFAPSTLVGDETNGYIEYSGEYSKEGKDWLIGVPDNDAFANMNWIRSGTKEDEDHFINNGNTPLDPNSVYENIVEGTWAPFRLTSDDNFGPMPGDLDLNNNLPHELYLDKSLSNLESVDIFFTSDKSLWTRCAVLEAHYDPNNTENNAKRGHLRNALSVDKNGVPFDTTGLFTTTPANWGEITDVLDENASTDPAAANYIAAYGMGWFPGYAINPETGERLNMAFAENSWLQAENGRDMVWNPTENFMNNDGPFNEVFAGGMHYIYVFRNNIIDEGTFEASGSGKLSKYNRAKYRMPAYDGGAFMHGALTAPIPNASIIDTMASSVFKACSWVGYPILNPDHQLLESDLRLSLRVRSPFALYAPGTRLSKKDTAQIEYGVSYLVNSGPVTYPASGPYSKSYERGDTLVFVDSLWRTFAVPSNDSLDVLIATENEGLPKFTFTTDGLQPKTQQTETAVSLLDEIHIVPNPYYGYSQYEENRIDNRIKIINLPKSCVVTIYTLDGTMIRQLKKDDETITSLDWDLKNHSFIPISGGVYIFHIDAPELGEQKVLKWFGAMRPADLDSF